MDGPKPLFFDEETSEEEENNEQQQTNVVVEQVPLPSQAYSPLFPEPALYRSAGPILAHHHGRDFFFFYELGPTNCFGFW